VPANVVTVFDEAYYEFLDQPPDTLKYVREKENVVVLRTFSKIHGLAGTRVGYGIAHREMIAVLQKTRQPFNVNAVAQIGALAALEDRAHQSETKRVVDEGRTYLQEQFAAMKLSFVPGAGNFVMVNVGDGAVAFQKLLTKKIIVRQLKGYHLPEWIRISIGTMEQNRKCIAALKVVLSQDRQA
jgi:histidinol-phosphate aminotransferase